MTPTLPKFTLVTMRITPAMVRTASHIVTTMLFLGGIGYVMWGGLFETPKTAAIENRAPVAAPPNAVINQYSNWKFLPSFFEPYWNDRFGGRSELISLRNQVLFHGLGMSPTPKIQIGQQKWLYLEHLTDPNLNSSENLEKLKSNVVLWGKEFERRQKWCAEQGIQYIVVIGREKYTIYPEYLAASRQRHPKPDPLPTLRETLAKTNVNWLDTTAVLLDTKAQSKLPVFFKKDSHWSYDGPIAVSLAVAKLIPGFPVRTLSDYKTYETPTYATDCLTVMGISPTRADEKILFYARSGALPPRLLGGIVDGDRTKLPPKAYDEASLRALLAVDSKPLRHIQPFLSETDCKGIRMVLISDSFGLPMKEVFAPECERFASVGTYSLPRKLLETEKPTVVVQVMVERELWSPQGID